MRDALPVVLVLIAVGMPVAGYVFVLDGVLIGAGDARYLAIAGGVNLVVYLPLLWWAGRDARRRCGRRSPSGTSGSGR